MFLQCRVFAYYFIRLQTASVYLKLNGIPMCVGVVIDNYSAITPSSGKEHELLYEGVQVMT